MRRRQLLAAATAAASIGLSGCAQLLGSIGGSDDGLSDEAQTLLDNYRAAYETWQTGLSDMADGFDAVQTLDYEQAELHFQSASDNFGDADNEFDGFRGGPSTTRRADVFGNDTSDVLTQYTKASAAVGQALASCINQSQNLQSGPPYGGIYPREIIAAKRDDYENGVFQIPPPEDLRAEIESAE